MLKKESFETPESKREESLAEQILSDPQVGDHLSEFYCFHLFVVDRAGDTVVTMEASVPCDFPKDGKLRMQTVSELKKRMSYESIPGYWVRGIRRGENVSGWYRSPDVQPEMVWLYA